MVGLFAFVGTNPTEALESGSDEILARIVAQCRMLAQAHLALAVETEHLMDRFPNNRRFRTGLRTFARHHRRAAWQHLEMAQRAKAARHGDHDEFEMADVVSA